MKIYLSGKISGTDIEKTRQRFKKWQIYFEMQGNNVINPFEIHNGGVKNWNEYMKKDIAELMKCDTIFMMIGWSKSKGALLEFHIANELGFKVIYETDLEKM